MAPEIVVRAALASGPVLVHVGEGGGGNLSLVKHLGRAASAAGLWVRP